MLGGVRARSEEGRPHARLVRLVQPHVEIVAGVANQRVGQDWVGVGESPSFGHRPVDDELDARETFVAAIKSLDLTGERARRDARAHRRAVAREEKGEIPVP